MEVLSKAFGFFRWAGINHYLNLLFVGFLIRSGLQVLSAHPKLYWDDACPPDHAWLKLSHNATGAAMSPAVAARFPGYLRIFGGRQPARSLHFIGLVLMTAFVVVHVFLVVTRRPSSRTT